MSTAASQMSTALLTAKVLNQRKRQQNKEKTSKSKESADLNRGQSNTAVLDTITATGSNSLLTIQATSYWPPTALSGPFCLQAQSSEQQGC